MSRKVLGAVVFAVGIGLAAPGLAEDFTARLGRVPVDSRTQSTIAGIGHATAKLDGDRLVVEGDFEGLQGAATMADLHMGPAVGVRGPAIHQLTVSKDANGNLSGSVQLSSDEIAALRAGRIYIELASAAAPDGNLWGWLFME